MIRGKGVHFSRAVNRAHGLSRLDRGIPEAQIMAVLGLGRTAVWCTRAAYLQGRVELAVFGVGMLVPGALAGNEALALILSRINSGIR